MPCIPLLVLFGLVVSWSIASSCEDMLLDLLELS